MLKEEIGRLSAGSVGETAPATLALLHLLKDLDEVLLHLLVFLRLLGRHGLPAVTVNRLLVPIIEVVMSRRLRAV